MEDADACKTAVENILDVLCKIQAEGGYDLELDHMSMKAILFVSLSSLLFYFPLRKNWFPHLFDMKFIFKPFQFWRKKFLHHVITYDLKLYTYCTKITRFYHIKDNCLQIHTKKIKGFIIKQYACIN